jgi:predicted RNA-binding protein with PUA-like domain
MSISKKSNSSKRKYEDLLSEDLADGDQGKPQLMVKYLIKTEPDEYGIDNLVNEPSGIGRYDGVRNYEARNRIRGMKPGDLLYFYHSNVKKACGIYGIAEVVGEVFPDPTAFDPAHTTYDPTCKKDVDASTAKWVAFNMKLVEKWKAPVLLHDMKKELQSKGEKYALADMMLFKNSRLSVQLVKENESAYINSIAKR